MIALETLKYEALVIWISGIKHWKIRLSYPLSVIYFAVEPFLFLLPSILYGLALVDGRNANTSYMSNVDIVAFVAFGTAGLAAMIRTYWTVSMGIRREEWTGTMSSIYIAPVSRFSLIGGTCFYGITYALIGMFLQLFFTWIIFGMDVQIINALPAILVLIFAFVACQGIGLAIAGVTLGMKQAWRFVLFLDSVMGMLAPAVFPLVVLPIILRPAAYAMPVSVGVEAFREAFVSGFTIYVLQLVCLLIILDILWIFLGYVVFGFFERRSRTAGSLGSY
ncbi:MAG: ABC transporter permease [Candidatus Hodarchaeota archaeon]